MPDDVKTKTPEDTQPNIQASEAMLGQMISNVLAGVPANTPTMAQDISAAAGGMPNTMFNLAAPNTPEEGDRMAVDMGINKLVEFMSGQMANFQGGPQPGSRSGTATQQATPQQPQQAAQPQAAPAGPTMNEPAPPDLSFLLNNANTLATKNDKTGMTAADGAQNYIQGMQGQQKANYWEDNWGNVVQIALGALIGGIAAHNGAVGYIPIAKALAGHGQKGIHEWFRTKEQERENAFASLAGDDAEKGFDFGMKQIESAYANWDGDDASFIKGPAATIISKLPPDVRAAYGSDTFFPGGSPTPGMQKARQEVAMMKDTDEARKGWQSAAKISSRNLVREELDKPGGGELSAVKTQIETGAEPDYEAIGGWLLGKAEEGKNPSVAQELAGDSLGYAQLALDDYLEPTAPLITGVDGGTTLEDGSVDPDQTVSISEGELEKFPAFASLRGKEMKYSEMEPLANQAFFDDLEWKESSLHPGKHILHFRTGTPTSVTIGGGDVNFYEENSFFRKWKWTPFIDSPVELPKTAMEQEKKKKQVLEQARGRPQLYTEEGKKAIDELNAAKKN